MEKNILTKSFEQIQTQTLPKYVRSIVKVVAKDLKRSSRGYAPETKQLEIAYATLYMRLYQRLGPRAEQFMEAAYREVKATLDHNIATPILPSPDRSAMPDLA